MYEYRSALRILFAVYRQYNSIHGITIDILLKCAKSSTITAWTIYANKIISIITITLLAFLLLRTFFGGWFGIDIPYTIGRQKSDGNSPRFYLPYNLYSGAAQQGDSAYVALRGMADGLLCDGVGLA